jgi:inorganic pyrophosphatase
MMNEPSRTLFRAHPWHGIFIGKDAPVVVAAYIEIVPTDTVKYEMDKDTGILKVDRPQKY